MWGGGTADSSTAGGAQSRAMRAERELPVTFQRAVSASLARRYPLVLATPGDNIGLTIGALREVERGNSALIIICVDLTEQVLCEATAQHAAFIVTYSPVLSAPISALSTDDVTGRILLKCAQHSLAVYSIHTACDNAYGGINDWLANSVAAGRIRPIIPHPEHMDAGHGRLLECELSTPLSNLVERLKKLLQVRHLRLALGAMVDEQNLSRALEACFVKTFAVQVGVATSSIQDCPADVLIASEMSHSDVLAANAKGVVVILTGRSTIERAYLGFLRQELQDEFADSDWSVKVKCSQVDSNPLSVV
uniref:NIF3-like protein 1 n=1 Tax=Coccolithus braarudii TaxID=221442 RepID=A0A7S0LI20_9EUKA|mmetsp:Transcript_41581/g.88737  ORF Transcript_41581/g.88737 Transcript_41581/m.88737 type:complete len:307 (+) Transcript_41581:5-925(+)